MHNNRSYHQERMFVADMAARAERDVSRVGIGNDLTDPNIDYAALARAYGMFGIGPIENPTTWGPRSRRRSMSSGAASRRWSIPSRSPADAARVLRVET